jgi:hypothetical protein
MSSPQLTLNDSYILPVIVDITTGKFLRRKWNKEVEKFLDYTWTDQVRLADIGKFLLDLTEQEILQYCREHYNVTEDIRVDFYQLQYVKIIK